MRVKYCMVTDVKGENHSYSEGNNKIKCIIIDDEEIRIKFEIGTVTWIIRNIQKYSYEHKGMDLNGKC